jgi:hypothetical protein
MPTFPVAGEWQSGATLGAPRGDHLHQGWDVMAPAGTPLVAAVSGTVIVSGNDGGDGGVRVWLQGDDGHFYYYAHLQDAPVAAGTRVGEGMIIGTVGSSGNASGGPPHLHIEIHVGSRRGPVVDPHAFFTGGSVTQLNPGNIGSTGNQPLTEDEARAKFPAWIMFLDDPEIGPIIRDAMANNRDPEWVTGQIRQTNWFRSRSESMATWDALVAERPEQAEAQRVAMRAELTDMYAQFGIPVDSASIDSLTEQALRFGWTATQLTDAVVATMPSAPPTTPGGMTGSIGKNMQDIKAQAHAYGLPMNDTTAYESAKRMAAGEIDLDGIAAGMQQQAWNTYTWARSQLDAGETMSSIMAPLRQTVANELGVPEASVDFVSDPYWQQLLFLRTEAGDTFRQPTVRDALEQARRSDGYLDSTNGEQRAVGLYDALKRKMGGAGGAAA